MNDSTNPATPPQPKRAAKRAGAVKPAKAGAHKESAAEEILHELFRLAKVDLRSSEHGKRLAREFVSALKGGK